MTLDLSPALTQDRVMSYKVTDSESGSVHLAVVTEADAGQRLDRFLAGRFDQFSRARLQQLIRTGQVFRIAPDRCGETGEVMVCEPARRVVTDERYRLNLPRAENAEPAAQEIALQIVFEDEHLVVIDKPAGMVVHPAPGHEQDTLVNALLAHCGNTLSGIGGVRRPGIVHRLDKDTSGLLVVAKSDRAHQGLSAQFQAHGRDGRLSRRYLALVWEAPRVPAGTIDAPLARSRINRRKMSVVSDGQGRRAITRFRVLQRFQNPAGKTLAALLSCELETGRTHQIRVHLAHKGWPVMADSTYGAGYAASMHNMSSCQRAALIALNRQALHAAHLGFEHPVSGEPLSFEAEMPEDMAILLARLAEPVSGNEN